jgi:cholest-4-en-3-one 26-monooxygenase
MWAFAAGWGNMVSPASSIDFPKFDLVSPEKYEREGYPHDEWTALRAHAPVRWFERPGFQPFWAITKHADIVEISKQPRLFKITPRVAVLPVEEDGPPQAHHLLTMDPPEHAHYRRVASRSFTPRSTQRWALEVERITQETLDRLQGEREVDFVAEVAAPITIAVIAEMLGLPREDWQLLFQWTNESIGAGDPEFQRGRSAAETRQTALNELFAYFQDLAEERRKRPQDDIISVIVHGVVDGETIRPFEALSYNFLLVIAGNETTRNAMTGGLLALVDHPDEWRKLVTRGDALLHPAVEEILRWTTPVNQFARTATRDYPLRDQTIREGDSVCLFYASANRDEDVFEEPFAFRVDRDPNDHIAFGRGEHVCLGAHLARLELRTMFDQLRRRVRSVERAGEAERVRSSFIGGVKRAPIRWSLGPA